MPYTPNEVFDLCRAVASKINDTRRCIKRATARNNGPLVNGLKQQLTRWEQLLVRLKEEHGEVPGFTERNDKTIFKMVDVEREPTGNPTRSTFQIIQDQEDARYGRDQSFGE